MCSNLAMCVSTLVCMSSVHIFWLDRNELLSCLVLEAAEVSIDWMNCESSIR